MSSDKFKINVDIIINVIVEYLDVKLAECNVQNKNIPIEAIKQYLKPSLTALRCEERDASELILHLIKFWVDCMLARVKELTFNVKTSVVKNLMDEIVRQTYFEKILLYEIIDDKTQ